MIDLRQLLLDAVRGKLPPDRAEEIVDQALAKIPKGPIEVGPVHPGYDAPKADQERYFAEVEQNFQKAGIEVFRVLSQRDKGTCPACFEHDGTEYTAEEVARLKPLPHKDCTNDTCRCDYLPILRD